MPAQIRVRNEKGWFTKLAQKWIEVHYPEHLQVGGAPIVTERTPLGTGMFLAGRRGAATICPLRRWPTRDEECAAVLRREVIEVDHEIRSTTQPSGPGIGG